VPHIAYLGPEGTFTEAALRGMVAANLVPLSDFEPFPASSPSAALEMVRAGDATYACVPIENSIDGSVLPTLDNLATGSPMQVFAEFTLDIGFTIAVRAGVTRPASIAALSFPSGLVIFLPTGLVESCADNSVVTKPAARKAHRSFLSDMGW